MPHISLVKYRPATRAHMHHSHSAARKDQCRLHERQHGTRWEGRFLRANPFVHMALVTELSQSGMVLAVNSDQWRMNLSRPGGSILVKGEGWARIVGRASWLALVGNRYLGSARNVSMENCPWPSRWACGPGALLLLCDPTSRYTQGKPFLAQFAHIGTRRSHCQERRLG